MNQAALTSQLYPLLSPARLIRQIVVNAAADRATMIFGPAGIGKSSIVLDMRRNERLKRNAYKKWAASVDLLSADEREKLHPRAKEVLAAVKTGAPLPDLRVVHFTVTQKEKEDFTGAPRHVKVGVSEFDYATIMAPMLAFQPEDGLPFILFLDEVNAAGHEVQKVLLQLVQERQIDLVKLPAGTVVTLAGNRSEDRASAKNMLFTMGSRCANYEMVPSAKSWLRWAEDAGIHFAWIAYVKEHGDEGIYNYDPNNPSIAQLSPRSYASAAFSYAEAEREFGFLPVGFNVEADDYRGPEDDPDCLFEAREVEDQIKANIGAVDGQKVVAFLNLRDKLPAWSELSKNGMAAKLPEHGQISEGYYVVSLILSNIRQGAEQEAVRQAMLYLGRMVNDRPDSTDSIAWAISQIVDWSSMGKTQALINAGSAAMEMAASHPTLAPKILDFMQKTKKGL